MKKQKKKIISCVDEITIFYDLCEHNGMSKIKNLDVRGYLNF